MVAAVCGPDAICQNSVCTAVPAYTSCSSSGKDDLHFVQLLSAAIIKTVLSAVQYFAAVLYANVFMPCS